MKIPDFVKTYLTDTQELVQISSHVFGIESNIEAKNRSSNEKNKKVIVLSGLSGSGKDSIMDGIMKISDKYKRVRTCTTRQRRDNEFEADDPHIRITIDQLHEMLIDGTALECTEYAGNYYCTSRFEIEKILNDNRIPLLRLDPTGAKFFLDSRKKGHRFLKDFDFIYIFIVPTSFQDLRERLVKRGSTPELIDERIEQSQKDITFINDTQYIIVNEFGFLDEVIDEVLKILG